MFDDLGATQTRHRPGGEPLERTVKASTLLRRSESRFVVPAGDPLVVTTAITPPLIGELGITRRQRTARGRASIGEDAAAIKINIRRTISTDAAKLSIASCDWRSTS